MREYQRTYHAERVDQIREGHLRRKFGMSLGDYSAVLEAQDGGCAICGAVPVDGQSLHVDHNDKGVRGILCVRCNNGLGQLQEDPELLLRAAEYCVIEGFAPLELVRREQGRVD